MKKLNAVLLAGVLCLAAAPAAAQMAQAPPAQMAQAAPAPAAPADVNTVTSNAVLAATETWRPIAPDLRIGGRLQVRAAGQWRLSPQYNPNSIAATGIVVRDTGPDGYTDLPLNADVLLPTAPIGALIGKIGENGAPFLIGSQYDQPIAADGALFVTINDVPSQLADNSGRLSIQTGVTPPPAPAPEIVPAPVTPPERPQQPAPDLVQIGLIGAAILVGLLILSSLFRGRRPRGDDRRNPAVPQVTARVVNDGSAGQSLTLTIRGR